MPNYPRVRWLCLAGQNVRVAPGVVRAPQHLVDRPAPYADSLPPVHVERDDQGLVVVGGHLAYAISERYAKPVLVTEHPGRAAPEDLRRWREVDHALYSGLARLVKPSRPTRAKRKRIEWLQTCPRCSQRGRSVALRVPQNWASRLKSGRDGYVSCPRCRLRLDLAHDDLRAFNEGRLKTADLWEPAGDCPGCDPACPDKLQLRSRRGSSRDWICVCAASGRPCARPEGS
jgi:hypothetical protein